MSIKDIRFNLSIRLGNDKMQTSKELADVLQRVARIVEQDDLVDACQLLSQSFGFGDDDGVIIVRPISDINGNKVGEIKLIEE